MKERFEELTCPFCGYPEYAGHSQDCQTQVSIEKPQKENIGTFQRIHDMLKKPLSRWFLVGLGLIAISSIGKPKHIEFGPDNPSVMITLDKGSECDISNWQNLNINDGSQVQPNQEISNLVSKDNQNLKEVGLLPLKHENKEKFNEWVEQGISEPDLLKAVGVKSTSDANAKQLIELGLLLVNKNLEYNRNVEKLEESAKLPIDIILKNHLPAECSHCATALEAVVNSEKISHWQRLKNVVIRVVGSKKNSHVYNAINSLENPNHADIAFIDPTARDVSWGTEYLNDDAKDFLSKNDLEEMYKR